MFINYLIVTLRRLQRHLGYSTLNVAGLAVGLATCLVIALFIHHEWSYDRFHPAADRVMRVMFESGEDGAMFYEEDGVRANAGFFRVFSGFTALHDNLATALGQPSAIVLTRSMAEKYFGTADVAGHTLITREERRIDPVAWRERSEQREVLEATRASFVPDRPLQVEVLADRIDAFYAPDRRLRTLSMGLTGIAMVLLVLGLLAITAYLARLRLKEVAIRKAPGASVGSILRLLNREFAALVAVAFAFGTTGAYLLMSEWLSGFATRISISPLVFVAVGLGAFGLAVAPVTTQSLSAARINPASVLQSSE